MVRQSTAEPLFGDSDETTLQELQDELAELERDANHKAEKLKLTQKDYEDRWDELLPVLERIQSLLSLRGLHHKHSNTSPGPTWTQWWQTFQRNHNLEVGLRHVQKKLKKLRERGTKKKRCSSRGKRIHKLTKGIGREVISAVVRGDGLAVAIAKALSASLPPRTLAQLIRKLAAEPFGSSTLR